jgi:predicted unusual protein kinase regulating ubiquinone biosynthesis (AarF/ABC1/UbiB family)
MLLNELAHGDLKSLCKKKEFFTNDDLLYNVFSQIMLSILTFQNFGYIHRDCHWGNFLYHYTNDDNNHYYHYNINKKDYYLKSCVYSIYIYDFGLSKKIKYVNELDISEDYIRLLPAFINKNSKKRSWLSEKIPQNLPSDNFSNFIINFEKNIINAYYDNKYIQNSKFLIIISEILISTLLSMPNNIFTDEKPLNNKIINKKPYYINNKIILK